MPPVNLKSPKPASQNTQIPTDANRKLFIGGLSYETTDESLAEYFSQFGELTSTLVLRDQSNGHSRGFGFVTFAKPEGARAALAQVHHLVDGRKVESKYAVPRRKTDSSPNNNGEDDADVVAATLPHTAAAAAASSSSQQQQHPHPHQQQHSAQRLNPSVLASPHRLSPSSGGMLAGEIIVNKIFVGGLRYATGHEALRSYFEQFGEVETAQVIFNRDTKKSRGFGFVVFRDTYSVDAVLRKQAQSPPVVEGKQVEVKTCVARQDSLPRAPPQTPISVRPVSATPDPTPPTPNSQHSATPSSTSFISPPPSAVRPVPTWSRMAQPWGMTSPGLGNGGDSDEAGSAGSQMQPQAPMATGGAGGLNSNLTNPDLGLFDMSAFTAALPRFSGPQPGPALGPHLGGGAFVDFAAPSNNDPARSRRLVSPATVNLDVPSAFTSPFGTSPRPGIW